MAEYINGNEVVPVIPQIPTGAKSITENGIVDVTNYATADVQVVDTDLVGLAEGNLVSLTNANITRVRAYAFYYDTVIEEVVLPNATTILQNAFRSATALEKVDVPSLINLGNDAFRNCSALELFIVSKNVTNIYDNCFRDSGLKAIILKRENTITVASNVDVFTNTPFRNGVGGVAYVPYNLITNYQSHFVWGNLESTTFKSIQENLAALYDLGVNITDYYEIVDELPTTDIDNTKTYWILDSGTTYHQYFHGSGSWEQLADIILGGE